MKKILTVSLFAMMAVSAANAEIASTTYVTDRTGTVSFTADGATKGKTNLTEAIAAVDAQVQGISNNLTQDITGSINELSTTVSDMDTAYKAADTELAGRVTTAEGEIDALQSGKADKATTLAGYGIADAMTATAINSAISTATTDMATNAGVAASIKEVTDVMATDEELSTAVSTLEGQIESAGADTTALAGRVSTAESDIDALQSGKADKATTLAGYGITDAMTATDIGTAISTAKSEAIAASDTKGAAAAAQTAAVEAAKTETTTQVNALADGAVKTNTDNISTITTNLGGLNGIKIPDACTTGRCALVMNAGKAEWETINY